MNITKLNHFFAINAFPGLLFILFLPIYIKDNYIFSYSLKLPRRA